MTKPLNRQIAALPTTIFTVMSELARTHDAINLGQGFPDTEGPQDMVQAAADALLDGRNQYAPLTGLPELRAAVADSNARFQGLEVNAESEVVVTSGATEALAACLMALIEPGDEVVLIEPLYDTYLPWSASLAACPGWCGWKSRAGRCRGSSGRRLFRPHQGHSAQHPHEPHRQGVHPG